MRTSDFDYYLPPSLVAQAPLPRRDESRLMVIHRETGEIEHRGFREIVNYLSPGDTLVLNDTRVRPARLQGTFAGTGGKVEAVLLHPRGEDTWEALVRPGRRARPGKVIIFGQGELVARVTGHAGEGERVLALDYQGNLEEVLDRVGTLPLPPYIKEKLADPERYQTVYAREQGSAAAPTAGLHFTPGVLEGVQARGINIVYITLHVGLGTFRPVKAGSLAGHRMHREYYSVSPGAARSLNQALAAGSRLVAVGTTSCRVLESVRGSGGFAAGSGWTDLFIYPGYRFQAVDALLTNFHLPRSTLLMLVCALGGRELVLKAYQEAIGRGYRFYSFGDAMLLR